MSNWPFVDVQGLKVDGKKISRSYLWHDEIGYGATVEFEMGSSPVAWDSDGVPPSVSTGGY